ncbi:hypothetical protein [Pseudidiomarina aestuarii]|uniref:hypothetical protein n=1 Tax=Pseudidiomarina aestuarii TaxID=624146 RepID=UPI003A97A77C
MNYCKGLLLATLFLFMSTASSEEQSELELPVGIYEGIYTRFFDYKTLIIDKDGKHRLVTSNMASGFRYTQSRFFGPDDLVCSAVRCVITLPADEKVEYVTQVTLIPAAVGWDIVELHKIKSNEEFSLQYKLRQNSKTPLGIQFVQRNKGLYEPASPNNDKSNEVGSVYIGYSEGDIGPHLIAIEFTGDNKARLQQYIADFEYSNEVELSVERLVHPTNALILSGDHRIQNITFHLFEMLEHSTFEGMEVKTLLKHEKASETKRVELIRVNPRLQN